MILSATTKRTNGRCFPCFRQENPFWPIDGENLSSINKYKINSIQVRTEEEAIEIETKHISELNIELRRILEKEIEAGNNIAEASSGWPFPNSIFVMLEKKFITTAKNLPSTIIFREVNDPKYWKYEYFDEVSKHILACRFD